MDYPNPNVILDQLLFSTRQNAGSSLYNQLLCIQEWKINFNISLGEKQLRKKNGGNYKAFQSQI